MNDKARNRRRGITLCRSRPLEPTHRRHNCSRPRLLFLIRVQLPAQREATDGPAGPLHGVERRGVVLQPLRVASTGDEKDLAPDGSGPGGVTRSDAGGDDGDDEDDDDDDDEVEDGVMSPGTGDRGNSGGNGNLLLASGPPAVGPSVRTLLGGIPTTGSLQALEPVSGRPALPPCPASTDSLGVVDTRRRSSSFSAPDRHAADLVAIMAGTRPRPGYDPAAGLFAAQPHDIVDATAVSAAPHRPVDVLTAWRAYGTPSRPHDVATALPPPPLPRPHALGSPSPVSPPISSPVIGSGAAAHHHRAASDLVTLLSGASLTGLTATAPPIAAASEACTDSPLTPAPPPALASLDPLSAGEPVELPRAPPPPAAPAVSLLSVSFAAAAAPTAAPLLASLPAPGACDAGTAPIAAVARETTTASQPASSRDPVLPRPAASVTTELRLSATAVRLSSAMASPLAGAADRATVLAIAALGVETHTLPPARGVTSGAGTNAMAGGGSSSSDAATAVDLAASAVPAAVPATSPTDSATPPTIAATATTTAAAAVMGVAPTGAAGTAITDTATLNTTDVAAAIATVPARAPPLAPLPPFQPLPPLMYGGRTQGWEDSGRILLEDGYRSVVVPVYDTESSSLIAYALASKEYHAHMVETLEAVLPQYVPRGAIASATNLSGERNEGEPSDSREEVSRDSTTSGTDAHTDAKGDGAADTASTGAGDNGGFVATRLPPDIATQVVAQQNADKADESLFPRADTPPTPTGKASVQPGPLPAESAAVRACGAVDSTTAPTPAIACASSANVALNSVTVASSESEALSPSTPVAPDVRGAPLAPSMPATTATPITSAALNASAPLLAPEPPPAPALQCGSTVPTLPPPLLPATSGVALTLAAAPDPSPATAPLPALAGAPVHAPTPFSPPPTYTTSSSPEPAPPSGAVPHATTLEQSLPISPSPLPAPMLAGTAVASFCGATAAAVTNPTAVAVAAEVPNTSAALPVRATSQPPAISQYSPPPSPPSQPCPAVAPAAPATTPPSPLFPATPPAAASAASASTPSAGNPATTTVPTTATIPIALSAMRLVTPGSSPAPWGSGSVPPAPPPLPDDIMPTRAAQEAALLSSARTTFTLEFTDDNDNDGARFTCAAYYPLQFHALRALTCSNDLFLRSESPSPLTPSPHLHHPPLFVPALTS